VLGTPVFAVWLGYVRPLRRVRRHLDVVCNRVALTPANGSGGLGSDLRGWVRAGKSWPKARGARSGYTVELSCQTPGKHSPARTTVVVTGTQHIANRVMLDRRTEVVAAAPWLKVLAPVIKVTARPAADWPDWPVVYDQAGEASALLTSELRALLERFPRRLSWFGFDDKSVHLAWNGMEDDTTVIEQAFALGVACAQLATRRIAAATAPR
jgi:hypothetical protein